MIRFVLLALAGCAAVPSGFGAVMMPPSPAEDVNHTGEVRAGSGVGIAGDRKTFELDASFGGAVTRWFGVTIGGSYVALDDPHMAPIAPIGQGFWPWLRPTFFLGPITISTPLSGFGLVGPEAGLWYGIAGLDVGIANPHTAVHAGIRYDVAGTLPGSEFSARQLVLGGQHDWELGRKRIGLVLEGIYGEQHGEGSVGPFVGPEGGGTPYANDETFFMVMVRISVAWRFDLR